MLCTCVIQTLQQIVAIYKKVKKASEMFYATLNTNQMNTK